LSLTALGTLSVTFCNGHIAFTYCNRYMASHVLRWTHFL